MLCHKSIYISRACFYHSKEYTPQYMKKKTQRKIKGEGELGGGGHVKGCIIKFLPPEGSTRTNWHSSNTVSSFSRVLHIHTHKDTNYDIIELMGEGVEVLATITSSFSSASQCVGIVCVCVCVHTSIGQNNPFA